jgi:small-conductance mechanosensitive channel
MSRIVHFAGWLVGAIASALLCWAIVVYALDRFDRGYGRDTWFALQLYLSAIAIAIGLVGYVAVALFRSLHYAFGIAVLAGIAFMLCQPLFAYVLDRAFPDREMLPHAFAGALVIGALSALWVRSDAA